MDRETEIEELERVSAWRLRLVDADPGDAVSLAAARLLEALADNLRRHDHEAAWTALGSIGNWLAESDAISDFAELAAAYRAGIGVSGHPVDGAEYLAGLLAIARGLL